MVICWSEGERLKQAGSLVSPVFSAAAVVDRAAAVDRDEAIPARVRNARGE